MSDTGLDPDAAIDADEPDIETPYANLSPDRVLAAIDEIGLPTDARIMALNSYENRVYQVGLDDGTFVVAKFYRPARWPDAAILEEHEFTELLAARDLPVVAPMRIDDKTLHAVGGHRVAVYPRLGGHAPDLERLDDLEVMGRFMARMHSFGELEAFSHRPTLSIEDFGDASVEFLLSGDFVPEELVPAWESTAWDLLDAVEDVFDAGPEPTLIRLHGDCHPGNVLWRDDAPHFVDFDDARMGAAIQDLWMLLSGSRADRTAQLDAILEGYRQFRHFDLAELRLIEAYRALRILHHDAWIARRWHDPAFPHSFPYFAEPRYWSTQTLSLREQLAALQEPPLTLY